LGVRRLEEEGYEVDGDGPDEDACYEPAGACGQGTGGGAVDDEAEGGVGQVGGVEGDEAGVGGGDLSAAEVEGDAAGEHDAEAEA